ncbi:MAG: BatD family protein [Gammaproteobacteria bacterium]
MTIFFLSVFKTVSAFNIDASLDRKLVQDNESFTLSFSIKGEDISVEPDLTPLNRNFEIISQQKSQQVNIVNGQINRETRWDIQLMSKTTGALIIPEIAFGKSFSPQLYIQVNPSTLKEEFTGHEDIFLETRLDKNSGMVGEQFILTIRFYRAVDLQSGEITEPDISQQDAIVERLGQDTTFDTKQYDLPYVVTERRYAIFPKKEGLLEIPSISFSGDVIKGRISVFDAFGAKIIRKKALAKPISLTVLPTPSAYQGDWLPASDLVIAQSWTPQDDKIEIGTPITRTIQVTVEGAMLSQLPEIVTNYPSAFKVYQDQSAPIEEKTEGGFKSQKQYKVVLMATQSGQYHFPTIRIPWWDTKTKSIKWAEALGREYEVIALTAASEHPGEKALPPQSQQPLTARLSISQHPIWPWATAALAILWLCTLGFTLRTFRKQQNLQSDLHSVRETLTERQYKQQVKQAAIKHDAKLTALAFLRWGQCHWPEKSIHAIVDIKVLVDAALQTEISTLNEALYGKGEDWNGQKFWQAFDEWKPNKSKLSKIYDLPPLYTHNR